MFFNQTRLEKLAAYFDGLVNGMNVLLINFSNCEVVFWNQYTIKALNEEIDGFFTKFVKNEEVVGNVLQIKNFESDTKNIKNFLNLFFRFPHKT